MKRLPSAAFAGLAAMTFFASPLCAATQVVPMSEAAWTIRAKDHRFESYKGEQSLFLSGGAAEAIGADFKDGVIEFDIALEEARGFSGIAFRVEGQSDYEHFYLRSHLSGQPDASQYTPVINGSAAWQILSGPRYGAAIKYRFNDWMHVKIVVKNEKADIYVDSDTPTLHVDKLMRDPQAGMISLTSSFAPARFANLKIDPTENVETIGSAPPLDPLPANLIAEWEVSLPFDSASLNGADHLSKVALKDISWLKLAVEENGMANLARAGAPKEGDDAVFVRLVVDAPRREVRRLKFGFSDEVTAFVNGEAVYSGSDSYASRDYRFLGTVGFFDTLHLLLKKGRNEIIFLVKESFGGWGITGAFEDAQRD